MTRVKVVAEDNSKEFVAAASSCDSGCKKACKKIDQHCCSKDGNDCLCQLPQFSCASEPSNMTRVKVVAEDNSKDFVSDAQSSTRRRFVSPCDARGQRECNDPSPELCCEQTADEYLCAEAWTDCVG